MEAIKELQWFKHLLLVEEGRDRSGKAAMERKGKDNLGFQTKEKFV